jgi:hypothetical protein
MGMGDILLSYGIFLYCSIQYDTILILPKKHEINCDILLQHLPLSICYIDTTNEMIEYLELSKLIYSTTNKIIYLGSQHKKNFQSIDINKNSLFWKEFYITLDLPYTMVKHFYIDRNYINEKLLFDSFDIIENEYIVVIDDPSRNYNINIETNDKIVYTSLHRDNRNTNCIFDYIYLFEHAKEIHTFDTCFMWLIELLDITVKRFFHTYLKNTKEEILINPEKWNIINKKLNT